MRKNRGFPCARAFTLVEIVVTLGILAVFIGTIAQLMTDSSRRLKVTANSVFAIQLAGKIMSDLSEEAQANPAFLEFLAAYPELTMTDGVVDAQSPYSRYLGDRDVPYGEIRPEADGGLHDDDGSIYDQYKPFRVGVTASRLGRRYRW